VRQVGILEPPLYHAQNVVSGHGSTRELLGPADCGLEKGRVGGTICKFGSFDVLFEKALQVGPNWNFPNLAPFFVEAETILTTVLVVIPNPELAYCTNPGRRVNQSGNHSPVAQSYNRFGVNGFKKASCLLDGEGCRFSLLH